MDLKPTKIPKVDGDQSRYSLVIAVAKRAREISEDAAKREEILIEKPVDLAVKDMMKNKYRIIPAEDNKDDERIPQQESSFFTDDDSEG